MTLFESGDSTGEVSLKELFDNPGRPISVFLDKQKETINNLIVKGGWPEGVVPISNT